jgi:hypothetical protein
MAKSRVVDAQQATAAADAPQMRIVARAAVLLGVIGGLLGNAGTYFIVTFLPQPFGILMPILTLAVPVALLWPRWFDREPPVSVFARASRRVAAVAAAVPAAVLVTWLALTIAPGFLVWTDAQHRQGAQQRGLSPAEVDAFVTDHRRTRQQMALGSAVYTAVPGMLAVLVTTAASAILFRRRPSRP